MTQASSDPRPPAVKPPMQLDIKAVIGLAGAAVVLITLAVSGHRYIKDCRIAGGDIDQCWDKGLAIAGMGAGGPLSAGVVLGYIVGTAGKEKEKAEKYKEGFWTLNPDLRDNNQP